MPRPSKCRKICGSPDALMFKPTGFKAENLKIIELKLDEFEALRLADYLEMYHEEAAKEMGVSRQTFGNILKRARAKTAKFLIEGSALSIDASGVKFSEDSSYAFCEHCGKNKKKHENGHCPDCVSI